MRISDWIAIGAVVVGALAYVVPGLVSNLRGLVGRLTTTSPIDDVDVVPIVGVVDRHQAVDALCTIEQWGKGLNNPEFNESLQGLCRQFLVRYDETDEQDKTD